MKQTILSLLTLCISFCHVNGQESSYEKSFRELSAIPTTLQFEDDFEESWQKNWHLDGKQAIVVCRDNKLEMKAGDRAYVDADHLVLWTKNEFEGDLKIEYDFTRLDSSKHYFVNILYIQAQGSGEGEYSKDIFKWNHLREIPKMRTYFNHMDTYHISYAVTGVPEKNEPEYIRARRYMPEWKTGLKNTNLMPEYFETGLFKKDVPYHLTFIKKGRELFLNVQGDGQNRTFYFDASSFPTIEKGRIGLRQMFTRSSRYENFKVYKLNH